MVRRLFIELLVLTGLLFFCGVYGAVIVRDAGKSSENPVGQTTAMIHVPEQASHPQSSSQQIVQSSATTAPEPAGSDPGFSFSGKISRLFLKIINIFAGIIENILQTFF